MPIIRSPIFDFLFIVCIDPEDAYIIKAKDDSLPSVCEANDIIEVCQEYLKIFTQEEIDKLNKERKEKRESEYCNEQKQQTPNNTEEEIAQLNQKKEKLEYCDEQNQQVTKSYNYSQNFPDGNVYLMGNERNGYTKIGFTSKKPEFRERTLQSEEPEIRLLVSFKGSFEDEARLHTLFRHKRLRGEWFDLSEEDIEVIKNYFTSI